MDVGSQVSNGHNPDIAKIDANGPKAEVAHRAVNWNWDLASGRLACLGCWPDAYALIDRQTLEPP
jgi:hypothetical protein